MTGEQPHIAIATSYTSSAWSFDGNGKETWLCVLTRRLGCFAKLYINLHQATKQFAYTNALIDALLGNKRDPYFTSPTSAVNCTYPQFTTLGVCVNSYDATNTTNITRT